MGNVIQNIVFRKLSVDSSENLVLLLPELTNLGILIVIAFWVAIVNKR